MSQSIVIFGAGSIGRSFIGQLFSRGGFEAVFIDVDEALIAALNRVGEYTVVIREGGRPDERIAVGPVRAVAAVNRDAVRRELAAADYIATSVGMNALGGVFPLLAEGIEARTRPVDIVIAENLHGAARFFREGLLRHLSDPQALSRVGLVETSIGKMVPIMRPEDLREDPLQVFAESYNTLIVDAEGFIGGVPRIEGLQPVSPVAAWVDRKLFIHNLGHAAAAYLGYRRDPEYTWLWEPLEEEDILQRVRGAMGEAGEALLLEYPGVFTRGEMEAHIDDLLRRFRNRALGETV